MSTSSRPEVTGFFDSATSSVTYVVADPASGRCAVIDPVLDYDLKAARLSGASADAVAGFVRQRGYGVDWVLDTHVHADHVSALTRLGAALGAPTGIGARVVEVQSLFKRFFDAEDQFRTDGSQFSHLFADGESFAVGGLAGRVWAVPGHTPACVAYQIGDAVFTGDALLMPDFGTARCDFPGGDAATLYQSVRRLLESLPPETRVFVGHDYGPNGRAVAWESTVAEQRAANIHIRDGIHQDTFVAQRTARDRTLEIPTLMLPSVQLNMRGGNTPPAAENGGLYLKIPLTLA